MSFLEIQTRTGWGRVLQSFADWCQPQAKWITLDIGCGPGLLPALLEKRGCHSFGVDLDPVAFSPTRLHYQIAVADAFLLPFHAHTFHLITASNLLFLLPDPLPALKEMARQVRPEGQVALLNPSENMSLATATYLADQRGLQGLERDSLLNWASIAEANRSWGERDILELFYNTGFRLIETTLKVGPGLARLAKGAVI